MPIIIEGNVTVSVKTLKMHEGHDIKVHTIDGRTGLYCVDDGIIEQEPKPSTSLWCGCPDQAEHDQGVALQTQFRKQYRMTKSACVGCYLGDDGPSMHSCYVHPLKDWPTA